MPVIRAIRLAVPMALVVLAAVTGCDAGASVAGNAYPSASPSTVAPTPRAHQAPPALLNSAIAALLGERSVHVACNVYGPAAAGDGTESSDIGLDSGRVEVTYTNLGSFATMLLAGDVYINITDKELLVADGFPADWAAKAAGNWIFIPIGDSFGNIDYVDTVRGLTLGSMAERLRLTGSLKRTAKREVAGESVYGVSGGGSSPSGVSAEGDTETVYIAASGAPLPVSVSLHTNEGSSVCDFSRWNEPLPLTAPPHPIHVISISS